MARRPPDPKQANVVYIENHEAPELYADGIVGIFIKHQAVTITLVSDRIDHSDGTQDINRVVIGRLILPVPAAQGLLVGLHRFLMERGLAPDLETVKAN